MAKGNRDMADLEAMTRAASALDGLAGELSRCRRPDGLAWWGPAAQQWRDDVGRDVRELRALADDLRRRTLVLRRQLDEATDGTS